MVTITEQALLQSIQEGFDKAFDATCLVMNAKDNVNGAGRLSAKFVYEVSNAIHVRLAQEHDVRLRVVKTDMLGDKTPGEWLVDACITQEHSSPSSRGKPITFIDRVVLAMESESNTSVHAFNKDFAKLVHLNAQYKLYLNGLDQTTDGRMFDYMEDRREYVESVLQRVGPAGEFYLGFWPSPKKPRSSDAVVDSIWKRLQQGQWSHLKEIRLWRFDEDLGELVEVRSATG